MSNHLVGLGRLSEFVLIVVGARFLPCSTYLRKRAAADAAAAAAALGHSARTLGTCCTGYVPLITGVLSLLLPQDGKECADDLAPWTGTMLWHKQSNLIKFKSNTNPSNGPAPKQIQHLINGWTRDKHCLRWRGYCRQALGKILLMDSCELFTR